MRVNRTRSDSSTNNTMRVSRTRSNSSTKKQPLKSALRKQPMSEERRENQMLDFGDVQVFEFPMILGDNPYCEGAPLQLAWFPTHQEVLDVDYYEIAREQTPKQRKFSALEREVFLLALGYTADEIVDASEAGRKTRQQRLSSLPGKKWDRFKRVMERFKLAPAPQELSARGA